MYMYRVAEDTIEFLYPVLFLLCTIGLPWWETLDLPNEMHLCAKAPMETRIF